MKYSVDIERSAYALAHCFKVVNDGIDDIRDWTITIGSGGIDYGIYFNFDTEHKTLEVSNQPDAEADDSLGLGEIIEEINLECCEE